MPEQSFDPIPTRHSAEAQEVVQETVIAVARKIGEFKADPARKFSCRVGRFYLVFTRNEG